MTKPNIQDHLTEEELNLVRSKGIKFIEASRQLYNQLCRQCQSNIVRNPKQPLEKYCLVCRQKARKVMQEFEQ